MKLSLFIFCLFVVSMVGSFNDPTDRATDDRNESTNFGKTYRESTYRQATTDFEDD